MFCLPGSRCDLHTTVCILCREQLPALITSAAPLSCSSGPQAAGSDPAMGHTRVENVGQQHKRRFCRLGGGRSSCTSGLKLPCPETPHQGSWHSQASSQLPALSHPSLGRGSGNAAAFSPCLDFWPFFLTLLFPGIPEKGLAGHAGCLLLTLTISVQTRAVLWSAALCDLLPIWGTWYLKSPEQEIPSQ